MLLSVKTTRDCSPPSASVMMKNELLLDGSDDPALIFLVALASSTLGCDRDYSLIVSGFHTAIAAFFW